VLLCSWQYTAYLYPETSSLCAGLVCCTVPCMRIDVSGQMNTVVEMPLPDYSTHKGVAAAKDLPIAKAERMPRTKSCVSWLNAVTRCKRARPSHVVTYTTMRDRPRFDTAQHIADHYNEVQTVPVPTSMDDASPCKPSGRHGDRRR
jgi:hypothetical protein